MADAGNCRIRLVLDPPLAPSVEVGRGTVLLLRGRLEGDRCASLRGLVVELDSGRQEFPAAGNDVFLPLAVPRHAGGSARLRVAAKLRDGELPLLDQIIGFDAPARPSEAVDAPLAICLATYEPELALLERQLASLRAQTLREWVCIVHDDGSSPATLAAIARACADDSRFRLFRSAGNQGFYRNFERALSRVPTTTRYVALCDQDDVWHPGKLETCVARLEARPRAQLVYSDMRVVDEAGALIAPTFWSRRRNNFKSFETLLFVNSVTGAASLFRGSLLDAALPFPPAVGRCFHDHWLACVAMVAGGLEYVDRPLLDYVQHGANVIGHSEFGALTPVMVAARHARNLAEMIARPSKIADNVQAMRRIYADDYRRLQVIAATLRLRFPDADAAQLRALDLFDGSVGQALRLVSREHIAVARRGDTTDLFEFRLGISVLVERLVGAVSGAG